MKVILKHYKADSYEKVRREFSVHLLLLGMAIVSSCLFVSALVFLKWLKDVI